jgi:hypothetical protein
LCVVLAVFGGGVAVGVVAELAQGPKHACTCSSKVVISALKAVITLTRDRTVAA